MGVSKLQAPFGKFSLIIFAAIFIGGQSFPQGLIQQASRLCISTSFLLPEHPQGDAGIIMILDQ